MANTQLHIIIEPEFTDSVCGASWRRGTDRDVVLADIREDREIGKNVCRNCLNKLGVPYKRRY